MLLKTTDADIAVAVCANRRRCLLAQAVDRQLALGGRGYIKVDANGLAYTKDKQRHTWHLPKTAVLSLRQFDEIGEHEGQIAARAAMRPASYRLIHVKSAPIPPPASRARKDKINARRNRIAAEERAQGIVRRTYKRYVGL